MANILFAWELGAHMGHLSAMTGMAAAFHERGHHVTFAVRDLRFGEKTLGKQPPYTILQAPTYPRLQMRSNRNPISYAEILQCYGYSEPAALRYMIKAWRGLYECTQPDAIVFNYAPTAQLAARTFPARRIIVSQGFFMPPRRTPMPPFVGHERISQAQLQRTEDRVMAVIRAAGESESVPPMSALHELFEADGSYLSTFPELDPYERAPEEASYIGPTSVDLPGTTPQWQTTQGKRIFAYLKAGYPQLEALLQALADSDCESHIFCPDISADLLERYQQSNLTITRTPYQLSATVPECDLVICHGGHGTLSTALQNGTPVLCLPLQTEQWLVSGRLQEAELGLRVDMKATRNTLTAKLSALLHNKRYTHAARAFAERYQGYTPQRAIDTVVDRTLEGVSTNRKAV